MIRLQPPIESQIVAMLETLLEQAKSGELVAFAYAGVSEEDGITLDYRAGRQGHVVQLSTGLRLCGRMVDDALLRGAVFRDDEGGVEIDGE